MKHLSCEIPPSIYIENHWAFGKIVVLLKMESSCDYKFGRAVDEHSTWVGAIILV